MALPLFALAFALASLCACNCYAATLSSLPPVVCDLNVAYNAASGLDEWPNALARLDIVSVLSTNLSSWVAVWVPNDAETLKGDSVSGALLVNPGGSGGQPCRVINTLDNTPITQGLAGARSFSYQFASSASSPQLFRPGYMAVNGIFCSSSSQSSGLMCNGDLTNCSAVWFCCGTQLMPPPGPPSPLAPAPTPMWITLSAAPGPMSNNTMPPSSVPVVSITAPHRQVAGIVAGAVAGAICLVAFSLVLRRCARQKAISHDANAGADADHSQQMPSNAGSDARDASARDAVAGPGDAPGGPLLRTRSLPVLLQRRASLKPQPPAGDEETGVTLRRSATLTTTTQGLHRTPSASLSLRRASGSSSSLTAADVTIDQLDFDAEIKLETLLGSGAFGAVYRARWSRLGGARCAVKMLHNVDAGASALASFTSEVAMLSRLQHPNIVRFLGACLTPPNACLIEELVEGGSLHTFLHGEHGRSCTPAELSSMTEDIASALVYLHTIPVVHRDLKAQNVLLDGSGRCKVCDFGLAKVRRHTFLSTLHVGAGTPAYMAPELFQGNGASEKVDVWAAGTLIWEMYTGDVPWAHLLSPVQVIYAIAVRHERLPIPEHCPPLLAELMRSCWALDPDERPSFTTVLDVVRSLQICDRGTTTPASEGGCS